MLRRNDFDDVIDDIVDADHKSDNVDMKSDKEIAEIVEGNAMIINLLIVHHVRV